MKKQKEKVVRFEMKLSYDEDDKLKSDSQKANLTKSEYVRRLIMNCRLKEKPDDRFYDIFNTCVFCLTNKRVLIGTKRLLWGSFLYAITPDLYNDTRVYRGLIWGKVTIDTVKEVVVLSNVSKSGLDVIETTISEFMMAEKKKYKDIDE